MMQKEIRVLHLGLSDNIGGIETVVHSWLKNKPEWIHFDFIQIGEKPLAFKEDFIASGSSIFQIPARSSNYFMSHKALKAILIEGKYDYLHHHIMSYSWPEPCIIANKCKSGTKVILHSHMVMSNNFELKYKILHRLGYIRLKNFDYLRASCSDEAGRTMFSCSDYHVVRNGIDFMECRFNSVTRKRIREEFGYNDEEIVIGHVGRSNFQKNYPAIIRTFSEVVKRNDKYRLLLIGDILNDNEIHSMIRSSGVGDFIKCTGPINNARQVYSAMDVYFMPSIREGVSVALLEAQASGLPCIVSSNISRESIISDLIQFVDIEKIENAVDLILGTVLSNEKRKKVKLDDRFDISVSSKSMFDFYINNTGSRQ